MRTPVDEYFMHRALSLAIRGMGKVSPNPLVGCVIVSDGKVISTGYHQFFGGPHAEINAIGSSLESLKGSTLYVNLEPCSHQGKTPPCAPRIVSEGIKRVVVGMTDPNPLVSGKGIQILRSGGVEVREKVLEEDCKWLNRGFMRRIQTSRPWVTVKAAISIDGSMALESGESKWITSLPSRKRSHLLRSHHDAIIVGMGTVRADNPSLTVRHSEGSSPLRVILGSGRDIPEDGELFHGVSSLLFVPSRADLEDLRKISSGNTDIVRIPSAGKGHIPFGAVLTRLGDRGVNSVMVEGGPSVISELLAANLVDEISLFISPRFMGRGLHFTKGLSFRCMEDTIRIRNVRINRISNDLWLEGVPECSPDL